MERVKERKGFILFLTTIFGNGETAQEAESTNKYDTLSEFYGLGKGMADLRNADLNVEKLEKAYQTSGKSIKDKVKAEAPSKDVKSGKAKAEKTPQKEEEREIGD